MHRDDADLILVFLTASVAYEKPVDDPWFSAHKEVVIYDVATTENITEYHPDSPFRALGCTVQVSRH